MCTHKTILTHFLFPHTHHGTYHVYFINLFPNYITPVGVQCGQQHGNSGVIGGARHLVADNAPPRQIFPAPPFSTEGKIIQFPHLFLLNKRESRVLCLFFLSAPVVRQRLKPVPRRALPSGLRTCLDFKTSMSTCPPYCCVTEREQPSLQELRGFALTSRRPKKITDRVSLVNSGTLFLSISSAGDFSMWFSSPVWTCFLRSRIFALLDGLALYFSSCAPARKLRVDPSLARLVPAPPKCPVERTSAHCHCEACHPCPPPALLL